MVIPIHTIILVTMILVTWMLIGHALWVYHIHKMLPLKKGIAHIMKYMELFEEMEEKDFLKKGMTDQYREITVRCMKLTGKLECEVLHPSVGTLMTYFFLWPNRVFHVETPIVGLKSLDKFERLMLERHQSQIQSFLKLHHPDSCVESIIEK